MQLSAIIITKDRYGSLQKTLDSLLKQTSPPSQIIIIDSSRIRNTAFLQQYKGKLPIKYIFEKQEGYGLARNLALKNSTGDIIATIDDDEWAESDWCEKILKSHQKNKKATAILGQVICEPKNSLIAKIEQERLDDWFLNNLMPRNRIKILSTKNASFKLNHLKKFNLKFAENVLTSKYGGEDQDLAKQIFQKGLHIIYNPQIKVHHKERKNLIEYLKQSYRKGNASALVYNRWPNQYLKSPMLGQKKYGKNKEAQGLSYKVIYKLARRIHRIGFQVMSQRLKNK